MKRFSILLFIILGLFNIHSSFAQVKIMPLGDSITKGEVGSSPIGGYRDDLYSKLVNAGINVNFVGSLTDGDGAVFDPNHEGHPGYRADEIASQIGSWLDLYQPEIVLLHIGTNDVGQAKNNNVTIGDIESIVNQIHSHNSSIKTLLCSIIPRSDGFDGATSNLNGLIEQLFYQKQASGFNIYYVGQNEVFKTDANWASDYLSDGVHPNNTGYTLIAEVFFNAITNVINSSPTYITDNFNRAALGSTWIADPEFQIVGNQLSNTSTVATWDHMAVYVGLTNSTEVSFKWAANADQAGIKEGGFALKLDAPAPNANGYLVWIGDPNELDLWVITNGAPDYVVDYKTSSMHFPHPGDEVKVRMSSDGSGHHFDFFINDTLNGSVTDAQKLRGNAGVQFAGIISKGNLNNDIDNFNIYKQEDSTPPAQITDLQVGTLAASSIELKWTAPGDDGTIEQASSYDIRYSTAQITDINFNTATQAANLPEPNTPGSQESFIVTGLNTNTKYYFAIKTADEVPNYSPMSNVVSATTLQAQQFVDNFERTDLGPNWVYDTGFGIASGELSNSGTIEQWEYIAVCNARKNPLEVSFTYGVNAPAPQAQDIENTAMTVMLDAASPNANGYMIWYRPSIKSVYGYTVNAGVSDLEFGHIQRNDLPVAVAGNVFKIIISTDGGGHHFDCYINGQYYGTISDVAKQYGNATDLYAGVMLHGNRNNNIDNFILVTQTANPTTLLKVSGDSQTGKVNTLLPQPFVVKMTDTNGNPVSDVAVNYTVIQGNGKLDKTAPDNNIRIEAENAALTAPMQIGSDDNASGGHYISTSALRQGKAEFNFYVTTAGTYYIWGRVFAANDQQDTYFAQMDSQSDSTTWEVVETSGDYGKWNWKKVKAQGDGYVSYSLQSGSHKFKILGREPLTKLDKILITNNPSYVPSGLEPVNGYVTDANGNATAYFTLGTIAGSNQVQSTSPILPGQVVNFTATGTVDTPVNLVKVSGDGLTGEAGKPLSAPFVAKVTDQYSNPVPNVPVTFTVIEGGGTLSNTQPVNTDQNGTAGTTLTLGADVITNKVKATSPGTTPSEIIFTATATSGVAANIVKVSGDNQTGAAAQVLALPFVVKVVDMAGNGIQGRTVNWSVTKGNGVIQGSPQTITNSEGKAQITFQLGTESDSNKVSATTNTFAPVVFTAIATSGIAKQLVLVDGNNQVGVVGKQLSNALKVKVVDAQGTGMANKDVTYVVTQGGGSIVQTQPVKTDANGIAQVNWKLGNIVGINKVEARAPGLTGSPVQFTATGNADVATKLIKVSGDSTIGVVNQTLAQPFVVKTTDQYNNPTRDVAILFTVFEGGGHFLNSQATMSVNTDSSGKAAIFLVLGPVAGQFNNKIKAEKSGLTGSPIVFTASASHSSAAKIVLVSGNNQMGFVQQPLAQPFVVKVMDASDNVVTGHPVNFSVQAGGGTLNGATQTQVMANTNSSGLASVTLSPGPVAGELNNTVNAAADNGQSPLTNSPIVFKASAKYSGTKIQLVSGNNQTAVVTSILPDSLKVKVLNASDQAVANQPVTFKVMAGGGTLNNSPQTEVTRNTNSLGIAAVTLKLGAAVGQNNNVVHAIANNGFDPLTGSPVIFNASAVASNAKKIQIAGGNSQTGVAGKALANTIQVSVLDSLNNGVANHPVTFHIKAGGGHFAGGDTVKIVNSNPSGLVELIWYLGTVVGTDNNRVQAESTDGIHALQGSPLIFTASVTADVTDPNASTIVATSPVAADGSAVSNVTVTLYDQYHNPISGKMVTIAVGGSHNFITPSAVQTGSNGKAVLTVSSITAEWKTITATNTTDNVVLNTFARVQFSSGPASMIIRVSGNDQTRNVGTALKDPLVVLITDRYNNPVANVPVYFEVKNSSGGGSLIETQPILSDTTGKAQVHYILGDTPGTNLIEAKSGTLTGSPVLFSLNGAVNAAAKLNLVSGNNQNGTSGQALAQPLVVQAQDANDNPVKNVAVTFSVFLGNGQVSQPQPVQTNAYGQASTIFTLGPALGLHIARAEAPGLQNSPISFIANASSDVAAKLILVSGDGQSAPVTTSGAPLLVRVLDKNDNPVSGYQVTFTVVSGNVTITNTQPDVSDNNGYARATFQFGSQSGACVIQAAAANLQNSPIQFHLTALPDVATNIVLLSGNNQRGTLGHTLIYPLTVKIVDRWQNPVPGFSVTWVLTQGDVAIVGEATVQSKANGTAICNIQLNSTPGNITVLAIASGLTGSPVTFNATAVANNFPSISSQIQQGTIEETQSITFQVTGSDPDSDPLKFNIYNKPRGAAFDSVNTTTRKFDWTPSFTQAGNYSIVLEVLDGNGGFARDTVEITVMNKNRKPVITFFAPPRDTSLVHGQGLQFSILATDQDQETIQYFWSKNGQKVAVGEVYNYFSEATFIGTDVIVGYATDGIDTVSHRWVLEIITLVEIESFTAVPSTEQLGIEISWVTRKEQDNLGFNVYRSLQEDDNYIKLNDDMILSKHASTYSYWDGKVEAGKRYYYKLEDVSISGIRTLHGAVIALIDLPTSYALEQNYPNPFNPETAIKFQIAKQVHVTISIFNVLGQQIRVLVDQELPAGYHVAKWDGKNENGSLVTSGIYYYRIQAGTYSDLKRMLFLK